MTTNQISYWNLQETKRHNLATESQAASELEESKRHNVVTEGEGQRHNLAVEGENVRHNQQQEAISYNTLFENQRHNVASENENRRHNQATEQATIISINETIRHNQASEALTSQSLSETVRHDVVNESINRGGLVVDAINAGVKLNLPTDYAGAGIAVAAALGTDIISETLSASKLINQVQSVPRNSVTVTSTPKSSSSGREKNQNRYVSISPTVITNYNSSKAVTKGDGSKASAKGAR